MLNTSRILFSLWHNGIGTVGWRIYDLDMYCLIVGIQPMSLNSSHGHGAMKYGEHGPPHNSDTFQDFVSLVCQEANNPHQPGQVRNHFHILNVE